MRQAIGDRAGEAATWHNLATLDLREGQYAAAREKFGKSLAIKQAIGDRAGEAATFSQLGALPHALGRGHGAVPLAALCWVIDKSIGHGDAERDFAAITGLASSLGYDQAAFEGAVAEAVAAYQADRGRGLIEAVFQGAPDAPPPSAKPKRKGWWDRLLGR